MALQALKVVAQHVGALQVAGAQAPLTESAR